MQLCTKKHNGNPVDAPQAFHCAEPGSRHTSCLPLFMSLLTYEVYYHCETAEGSTQTEVNNSELWGRSDLDFKCSFSFNLAHQRQVHGGWQPVRCREWEFWSSRFCRSRCPPSATTAPGWSRRWPGSRSARCSSAACVPWPPPTCWCWLLTLRAATSCRPSSPHPVTKEEERSSRDWRYESGPEQLLLDWLRTQFFLHCFLRVSM